MSHTEGAGVWPWAGSMAEGVTEQCRARGALEGEPQSQAHSGPTGQERQREEGALGVGWGPGAETERGWRLMQGKRHHERHQTGRGRAPG